MTEFIRNVWPSHRPLVLLLGTLSTLLAAAPAAAEGFDRSLDAGAGWLIPEAEDLSDAEYRQRIEELTADDTVRAAVAARQRLYRDLYLTPADDRSRAVFLLGEAAGKTDVECGFVFQPMEIWSYGDQQPALVFYRDDTGLYRLWLPTDGKPMLYSGEMRYYLEQWEQFKGRISGSRFDKRTCEAWQAVDEATGVDGLFTPRKNRPTDADILAMMAPPTDAASWAESVATPETPILAGVDLRLYFPQLRRQRMETLFIVDIAAGAGVEATAQPEPVEEALGPAGGDQSQDAIEDPGGEQTTGAEEDSSGDSASPARAPGEVVEPELRVVVEGALEHDGGIFDRFRLRFRHPVGEVVESLHEDPGALKLSFTEPLRPGEEFVARLRIIDPTSGRKAYVEKVFEVPRLPVEPPLGEAGWIADEASAVGFAARTLAEQAPPGGTQLYLVPPLEEVVFGVVRAEAVVVGKVKAVIFLVDGKAQLTRTRPPFTAELNLADIPRQQVIRAEAVDSEGVVVASDELLVNQPRGVFSIRIVDPKPQQLAPGATTMIRAEITLPPERRVERVEFTLDDEVFATLTAPPWEAGFTAPPADAVAYLAAAATLTTGARVEDVVFLNAPELLEEVDVQLVELLTTVIDSSGRPFTDVAAGDFEIYDNGRLQQLQKFEVVENLPLLVGFAIDTSSSMKNALPEAKRAVLGFLDNTVRSQDRVFSIAFSTSTEVLTPPTDDFALARGTLDDLVSYGGTALNDALVTSLFFARGFEGRKVLILLSDGEDTASRINFDTAMNYARASGTVIYTVGLKIEQGSFRRQLERLATETGGRAFTISKAVELEAVYQEIAEELRHQVLLAYAPAPPGEPGSFHAVEVKVKGRGLRARTTGGYIN